MVPVDDPETLYEEIGTPMVKSITLPKKEGPKFMQRLVAKQKARVKDSTTWVGKLPLIRE